MPGRVVLLATSEQTGLGPPQRFSPSRAWLDPHAAPMTRPSPGWSTNSAAIGRCPETGRARLSYRRAEALFARPPAGGPCTSCATRPHPLG
jgi:hypothetical protein